MSEVNIARHARVAGALYVVLFVLGHVAREHPELVREIAAEG